MASIPTPTPAQLREDHAAMVIIAELLDGNTWDANTLNDIADVILAAGYHIRNLDENG